MRFSPVLSAFVTLLASGCATQHQSSAPMDEQLAAAEALIDAFYSFDNVRLRTLMSKAPSSAPQILYYQGWAEGGNYEVLDRKPCRYEKAAEIRCDITVRDDLIPALGSKFNVTDSFHISLKDGQIVAVKTTSNDPPEAKMAFEWLMKERSELFSTGALPRVFCGRTHAAGLHTGRRQRLQGVLRSAKLRRALMSATGR